MAYQDRNGDIKFSPEDKKLFEECRHFLNNKKTPIADSIMRSILPKDFDSNYKNKDK